MGLTCMLYGITLAPVLTDLGAALEAMLQPETQRLLHSIGNGDSWLQQLLQPVQSSPTTWQGIFSASQV